MGILQLHEQAEGFPLQYTTIFQVPLANPDVFTPVSKSPGSDSIVADTIEITLEREDNDVVLLSEVLVLACKKAGENKGDLFYDTESSCCCCSFRCC